MKLESRVLKKIEINESEKEKMFRLMNEHYDYMDLNSFKKDLEEKDYCIFLYSQGEMVGFSTQKIIELPNKIYGVFSGDTIIHKSYWGSIELYRAFANFFIKLGEEFPNFYWFLISKGYKTYKMLPLFFQEFYPTYMKETPNFYRELIKEFGLFKYPKEFCKDTGLIKYSNQKDRVKKGIADILEKHLADKDIEFFLEKNPLYHQGNDLVCIAELTNDNLKPRIKKLLLGEKNE